MSAPARSTPADVALRDVRWTDLRGLTAIETEVFPDDAWSESSWWEELALRPRRDYVVAVDESGSALGYGGLDHTGEVSDVMTVVVGPEARGRGLGRFLLDELERRARGRGARHVMLEVRADNTAAVGLYTGAGYEVLSTRRGYYRPAGVDALVMRRTLVHVDGRKDRRDG